MALFSKGKSQLQPATFEEKCALLGEFWLDYREEAQQDESWSAFLDYADVGLPLSHVLDAGYATGASEDGVSFIDETWDRFCEILNLDPQGHYESLEDMFDQSPQPAIEQDNAAPPTRRNDPNDHGLEGFMGWRVPDRERTIEYVLGESRGSGQNDNGSADVSRNEPDITVTKNAWREIGSQCRTGGMARAQVRLHILPCQCGGHHWGLSLDEEIERDDVLVSNGSATIVLDPVSAKNAQQTYLDTEGRGGSFLFSMTNSNFCECGDYWRPTMAVAAMAVAFGFVTRRVAIANGWLQESEAYGEAPADHGGDYSDSGGSDYDFDFDMGGF